MRAHSFALSVAAVVGAFALFATPAEAGGRKHHRHCYNGGYGYYNGGYYNGGYYRPYYRNYYRPRYYYQPVFYPPVFQIGFAFGGGGYCR
jgi:hypothetical protein